MKLREILIDSASMANWLYAKRPWSLESAACIKRHEADNPCSNCSRATRPFEYFLEAVLIKDIRTKLLMRGRLWRRR